MRNSVELNAKPTHGGEPLRGEPSPRSNENVYKQPNSKRFPRKKIIALCSTVTKDQLRSAETHKPSAKIFIAPENLTKALRKTVLRSAENHPQWQ